MGTQDIPAISLYIKNTTKVDKLTYIGHSQGTTQFFAGFTLNPELFRANFNGMIALGPVTALNRIDSSVLKVMAEKKIDSIFRFLNINEIFQSNESVNYFTKLICVKITSLCSGLLELLSDNNPDDDDSSKFLVYASHYPAGSSFKALRHFFKIIRHKGFIDYNLKEYDLNRIENFQISMLVGKDDKLSTVLDNRQLRNKLLENNSLHFYKEYDNMGHATFFLNKNNIYIDDVIKSLTDYTS